MTHSTKLSRRSAVRLLGGLGLGLLAPPVRARVSDPARPYRYGSGNFSGFIADSYSLALGPKPQPFEEWLEAAYRAHYPESLSSALARHRAKLAGTRDLDFQLLSQRASAAWLHKTIKLLIPRFSLERGFEFANAVRYGERQCLLQSVLIAGLLQEAGLEAGVVMVWKNHQGKLSNLGHAVTLLRLADGHDLLVDASDPTPFMQHQGLYGWDSTQRDYRFVEPRYTAEGSIVGYRRTADGKLLCTGDFRPLDLSFLHSQFDFYRGERAPGGFMGPSTPAGLLASARFLERSIRQQPRNPLAVYLLGHVYRKQERLEQARLQYRQGYRLYRAQGFIPDGPKSAYTWATDSQ